MKLYVHATDASAEALADFIDYQYGPGLRIVPAAEMDAKWTPEGEVADTAREKACRERESKPAKGGKNDRKKRDPSTNKRP